LDINSEKLFITHISKSFIFSAEGVKFDSFGLVFEVFNQICNTRNNLNLNHLSEHKFKIAHEKSSSYLFEASIVFSYGLVSIFLLPERKC